MGGVKLKFKKKETTGSIFDAESHGNINFTVGPRGLGKTHDDVCYNFELKKDWDLNKFFTNEMYDYGRDLTKVGLHHGRTFRDLWKTIAKIREENPYEKVKVGIDEAQETLHRFRSTSAASVIFDRWLRQLRKQSITVNMITQNTYSSIPINILYQGDNILIKSNDLLDDINDKLSLEQLAKLNPTFDEVEGRSKKSRFPKEWHERHGNKEDDWMTDQQYYQYLHSPIFGLRFHRPPGDPKNKMSEGEWDYRHRGKALRFRVDISNDIFKQVYPDGLIDWEDIKKFKEYKLTLEDCQGVKPTQSCPWTDSKKSGPTFNSNAHASFGIFDLNGEKPTDWVPDFMREIGGVTQEELPQTVFEFFESRESEDKSLINFRDLSDSRKAVVIYETSRLTDGPTLTQREAAAVYGLKKSSIRKAESRWDDYMIDKHVEALVNDESSGQISNVDGRPGVAGHG